MTTREVVACLTPRGTAPGWDVWQGCRNRNRRTDFCHQTAHRLTTEHELVVVVEDLRVRAMTASARGSVEQPGTRVCQKAGLNRSILDQA